MHTNITLRKSITRGAQCGNKIQRSNNARLDCLLKSYFQICYNNSYPLNGTKNQNSTEPLGLMDDKNTDNFKQFRQNCRYIFLLLSMIACIMKNYNLTFGGINKCTSDP